MKIEDYDFELPQDLIAHMPAEPRDSSRLLVYSTKTNEIVIDTFSHLSHYLPEDSLLVLNDTQVVPARLELVKLSGGAVRILFLLNEWNKKSDIKGLPDRKITIGDTLFFNQRPIVEVVSQVNEEFTFKLLIPVSEFEKIYHHNGQTPLPPYIHSSLNETESRQKYQTVFATQPASIAAPTASLHFTQAVFNSLALKNIEKVTVTLHVGRGTFSPLSIDQIKNVSLHAEPIVVTDKSAQTIAAAKKEGRTVISSGTTATRTLESTAESILSGKSFAGDTSLMIVPPYNFKIVDAMITNFHLPKTSLLLLVDAFLQSKGAKMSWKDLYARAIQEKFRFYSFGDAMLII